MTRLSNPYDYFHSLCFFNYNMILPRYKYNKCAYSLIIILIVSIVDPMQACGDLRNPETIKATRQRVSDDEHSDLFCVNWLVTRDARSCLMHNA